MSVDFQYLAVYARSVENNLRQAVPNFTPLIDIVPEPEGVTIRACAWLGDKDHVVNTVVKWSSCTDVTLREAVDSTGRALRQAVRTDRKE